MLRSHASFGKVVMASLAAALAAFALAGCVTVQVPASSSESSDASSSGSSEASSSDSSSSSSSIETLSSLAASSSSASASTTGGATSSHYTSATGKMVTYTNTEQGYMFDTDQGFTADTKGSDVTVYTNKSGQAPLFSLTLSKNTSGQSAEDLMTGAANKTVERLGDRIVIQPYAKTIKLSNRSIKGYEYAYTNEKGDKTYASYSYVEEINGYFFMWSATAELEDTETPQYLEYAMNTLQFKTA